MAVLATLPIDRPADVELAPVGTVVRSNEAVARLAYPYHYRGDADPHLSGQPCSLLAAAGTSTGVDRYAVAFACGCRNVVPRWTLVRDLLTDADAGGR